MSAMEQSLRRALEAGDASDPAFRETIYAASERALERMLETRPVDEESAQAQRIRLAETINRVEQDYYVVPPEGGDHAFDPAYPGESDAERPDEDAFGAADGRAGEPETTAVFERPAGRHAAGDVVDRGEPAPVAEPPDEEPTPSFLRPAGETVAALKPSGGRWDQPKARNASPGFGGGGRSRRIGIFLALVLAALLVIAYLVYGMIFGSASDATGTQTSAIEAPAEEAGWITLFDGTQLSSIATPAGGRVETVTGAGDRPAVRMTSAGEGGEIVVAVGPGVVPELAGRTVRVEVTVGSPDGQPREFGVRCPFGEETACGRQRFTTVQSSESFVFDMSVPAGTRTAGGIAFDPGFGTDAKPLDLYGVRARVGDQA